jgi:hypothetical protein
MIAFAMIMRRDPHLDAPEVVRRPDIGSVTQRSTGF